MRRFWSALCVLVLSILGISNAAAQDFVWAKQFGGISEEVVHKVAVDTIGNVYTVGGFQGTVDFDPGPGTFNLTGAGTGNDIFVSKLDSSGNFVWAKQVGGPAQDQANGVVVDTSGNVTIAGYFAGTADFDPSATVVNLDSGINSTDSFILRLDGSGNFVWVKHIDGTVLTQTNGVVIDVSGNIYSICEFRGTTDFDPGAGTFALTGFTDARDTVVSKFDSSGNFVWAKQMGGSNDTQAYGVAVDSDGNVFTVGRFADTADFDPGAATFNLVTAGNGDVFVSKINAAGSFVWAKRMGGAGEDTARGVSVDASGNVYITGYFRDTADVGAFTLVSAGDYDIFVIKLDSPGNFLWAKQLGGLAADQGNGIDLDGADNIYAIGSFQGTADFDPGAGFFNLVTAGGHDVFVSKLNSAGTFVSARQLGGSSSDVGNGIAVDNQGYQYVAGEFRATADFDPGVNAYNITALGIRDAFVAKLGPFNVDSDGDGFTPAQGDCDDSDPNVRPNATEIPGNGKNDDCNASTLDSGTNVLTSYVAFATQPETRIASAAVYLDQLIPPAGPWLEIAQQPVSASDGTFSFGGLPDGTYRVRVRITWQDRVTTPPPTGNVTDNRFVQVTSGDISVTNSHVSSVQPLLFPVPVVLVHGWREGSCLSSANGTPITCSPDDCSGLLDYWSDAFSAFLNTSFVTFVADGLIACGDPNNPQQYGPNLHVTNGGLLGQYLTHVASILDPLIVGNKMPVDLVTHSMGGLTSRAYIAQMQANRPVSVRRFVMLGTPNAGAKLGDDALGSVNWKNAETLSRVALRLFNDEYGDDEDTNGVLFYTIVGDGGPNSSNFWLNTASIAEPEPNDGPVSRQSAVHYPVPDSFVNENENFRTDENCLPAGSTDSCLIDIESVKYLCTSDDHNQLTTNPNTLTLAKLVLLDQPGLNNEVANAVCSDVPLVVAGFSPALLQGGSSQHLTRISAGVLTPSGTMSHNHVIDASPESVFSVIWTSGSMSFTLEDPLGGIIDPNTTDPDIDYQESIDPVSGLAALYTIQNPMSGIWILNLTAGLDGDSSGVSYIAKTTSEAEVVVTTNVVPGILDPGQTAVISVTTEEQATSVVGGSVSAVAKDADGVSTTLSCADDGNSPDATANDGTFSCSYGSLTESGIHSIQVVASGLRTDSFSFERTEIASLSVNAADVYFAGTFSETPNDVEPDGQFNSLSIDVDLTVLNQGIFSLEGSLVDSSSEPIATVHLQSQALSPGSRVLTLMFDGTAIRNHGVNGPYTLTNLAIRRSDRDLVPADTATNAYSTASYLASDFQLDDPDGDGVASSTDLCPFVSDPSQIDTDTDTVGDACDNCPSVSNVGQQDQDFDGFGDACDLCSTIVDAFQGDIDGDLVGNNCDPDIDGDGVANAMDCNQLNPSLWSQAPEITGLSFQSDGQTLTWDAATTADGAQIFYDIVKGDVADLRQTQTFDKMVCSADNLTASTVTELSVPQTGHAFYYIIRAVTACSKGSYGTGALGERVIYSCP